MAEIVLKERFENDDETNKKIIRTLKSSDTIEKIYEPELLNDKDKLEKKLREYINSELPTLKEVTMKSTTSIPQIQKIIIKNDTVKSGFDICSLFNLQFFIGITFGMLLGLPIGAGIVMYVKRGKTYNYAINKSKPNP
jgi:hypothetical protein